MKSVLLGLSVFLLFESAAYAATVRCRFEPIGRPMTYLQYDTQKRKVWVQSGWPAKWRVYKNIEEYTGLPPYRNKGISLVAFGDVPIIHIRQTFNGTTWYERTTSYPFEAYWGIVPGGPARKSERGVCWTDGLQPVEWGHQG